MSDKVRVGEEGKDLQTALQSVQLFWRLDMSFLSPDLKIEMFYVFREASENDHR